MGRIAFVFSGQGDQAPGMGKDIYDMSEATRRVFAECDAIRPGTSSQCFEGTEEELRETKNTQPCMFAMELAAAAYLTEKGIVPEAAAGFSLGEVAAAAYTGVFDLQTGFRLVIRRGELMQEAAERQETAMAAVVRLSEEKVRALCAAHKDVYPVNFNCPGQISVSGLTSSMPAFYEDVKAAGGKALPIKVRGAFHSPFMHDAAVSFAADIAQTEIREPKITLYSNLTALPYGDAKDLLPRQIENPVRWEDLIRNMISGGIDTFIEVGPGKKLVNMIKKIDPEVKLYSVSELDTLLSEVKNA